MKKMTIKGYWLSVVMVNAHLGYGQVEHRQCAKHVLSSFKKKYPGARYETLFWKACKASTEPLFSSAMKEIQMIILAAYVHLMGRNPKSCSRTFFQT
uniref:MULE transposase domain-containing protein n=1 Tax=Lactuca sativa TaxID=4236 RepID=A0A9R1W9G3_LACSA|nr:hypothetical protein LSAT_V11C300124430 [Lactuca sativa]